jgi:hypothetical protein
MIKEAESALRTMARDLHLTTKSGFVRVMLPAIEDALKAGHTRKAVWQQLHEQNPALGYKEFCVYLGRLRKRAHQPTALRSEEKALMLIPNQVSHTSPPEFDPLANLRRAEANRPGFHYRGTEDLHELVYGTKKIHSK